MGLTKSKIEYVRAVDGRCWNIITGCNNKKLGICKLPCWAEALARRYKGSFEPTFHFDKLDEPLKAKKSTIIWVCLTGEVFSDYNLPNIDYTLTQSVAEIIKITSKCPQHIFLFLTKRPEFYKEFNFPANCWLGTTVNYNEDIHRITELTENKNNKLWVSFEPLLGNMEGLEKICPTPIDGALSDIDWVVIGGQSQPKIPANEDGFAVAIENCNEQTPIYLKDNTFANAIPTEASKKLPFEKPKDRER